MMVVKGNGQRVGYVRVSSVDQNTERQLEGQTLNRVFTDKCSGKDTHRPQLQACLGHLREGDTLVVHSMDRLARNVSDLLKLVTDLTDKGMAVEFVKEHLVFRGDDSAMSRLMLTVMGGVAEFERAMIRERQREGIAMAKEKGVYKGRKQALNVLQAAELRKRLAGGESKAALAKVYGITRQTVYSYLKA